MKFQSRFQEVAHIIDRRPVSAKSKTSLDNTKTALSRFSLTYPNNLENLIIVAGTNGKGTTAKTIATLLEACGHKVGFFSSPHLVSPCERIQIQGQPVSETRFVELFEIVHAKTSDLALSHFETLTLMAAVAFFGHDGKEPLDYAVLEVGLGGLYDPTNAIPHRTSVITTLSLDHQEVLGNSLTSIAAHKFGIVHNGSKVFHLPLDRSVADIANTTRSRTASHWHECPAPQFWVQPGATCEPKWTFRWGSAEFDCPLMGARAVENANFALFVVDNLLPESLSSKTIEAALSQLRWPGRMQRCDFWNLPCPLYLSGDHNEAGMASLTEILRNFRYDNLHIILGSGERKDINSMLSQLSPLHNKRFYFTAGFFRAKTRADYLGFMQTEDQFFENLHEALLACKKQATTQDLAVVSGSLYLVGEALRGPASNKSF